MSSSYTYESTSSAEEGSSMDTVEQPEGGYSVLDFCATEGCSRLRQFNVGYIWSCCCKKCKETGGREHNHSCDERNASMQHAMANASDEFRVAVQSNLAQDNVSRPAPKWQPQEPRRVVWKPVCSCDCEVERFRIDEADVSGRERSSLYRCECTLCGLDDPQSSRSRTRASRCNARVDELSLIHI